MPTHAKSAPRYWLNGLLALACAAVSMSAGAAVDSPCLNDAQRDEALALLNGFRSQLRQCGGQPMRAVPALRWNDQLAASAQSFSAELAQRDVLTHEGLVAVTLRDRLRQVGYRIRLAGENLSAGPEDVGELMDQWFGSTKHCGNIMLPDFEEVGLGCAPSPGRYGRYWVLHLAAPMLRYDFPAPGEPRSP